MPGNRQTGRGLDAASWTAISELILYGTPGALKQHPALVLNADYRPLSYYPLSLWPWQDAVKAAWLDRVDIVAEYDEVVQ